MGSSGINAVHGDDMSPLPSSDSLCSDPMVAWGSDCAGGGAGDQCLYEACCDNSSLGSSGTMLACRYSVNACSGRRRSLLDGDDEDFDELDDLALEDGAPGVG